MTYFDVTTPLASNNRCDTEAEVTEAIRVHMESGKDSSLDSVTVIEVPGQQSVENGHARPASDFWPPSA